MVEPGGSVLASEVPSRRPKIGRAITTTAARAPRATSALRASTTRAQRSQKPLASVLARPPAASAARSRRDRTLGPRNPSMAGRKVREAAMVSATAMAAPSDGP